MEQNLWKITDETLDQIAEEFDQLLDSPAVTEIKKLLCDLDIKLGTEFTVSLSCIVDVCDENADRREHALRLLTTGLSFSEKGEVYRTSGDSSPQRYVVDGDIQVVPNDQCPKCWGQWDFKWLHRSCTHCDAVLGENCRILLDSDVCPHCEKGKVSAQEPHCKECGFEVDPSSVVWG
jgi:hypothetical protein